jgi:hypothetical protein
MKRSNKRLRKRKEDAEFLRLAITHHLKPITDYLAPISGKRKRGITSVPK